MKNPISFLLKVLLSVVFILFFFSGKSFSQSGKFPAQFNYNSKSGKFQKGDDVTLTFLLTEIKTNTDYQNLYATFSKQDLLKKVVMSPYDPTNNSALCSFTYRTPVGSHFKPNYVQKVFVTLGVSDVYFDNEKVETSNLVSYMLTKEKQEHPEQSGK